MYTSFYTFFKQLILEFQNQILDVVPGLVFGVIFLLLAYLGIRVIRTIMTSTLNRLFKTDKKLIGSLILNSTSILLWFGTLLILFNILGLGNIAASLGTASGFAVLGFSFALSNVIADIVAGVYLIQDPDFSYGDRISTGSVTGTVKSVELRKSRIETDAGDIVVLANSEVEKMWTRNTNKETSDVDDVTDASEE